jgi:hypothetical protein
MGAAPASFMPTPKPVLAGGAAAANISDHVPMLSILPFGLCRSPSNPVVAAATAAASGTLTPMPCVPATPAPWSPGAPTVTLGGAPALGDTATLSCVRGGTIPLGSAGQATVQLP